MAIIPTYVGVDERTQKTIFGLSPTSFFKVTNGYGCPECLEDFNGVYKAVCPVCGHKRDVASDIVQTPRHWLPDPTDPDRRA